MKTDQKAMNFRDRMRAARPDVEERRAAHREKSALAMKLLFLRGAWNMSQADVVSLSSLTISDVAHAEALTGKYPDQDVINRYLVAVRHVCLANDATNEPIDLT